MRKKRRASVLNQVMYSSWSSSAGDRRGIGVAHRAPQRAVARHRAEHALDALDHLADAALVQLDALARVVLRALPVARFEAPLRALRDRAEARVVVGETGAQFARADFDQGLVDLALHRCGDAVHARSLGEKRKKKALNADQRG